MLVPPGLVCGASARQAAADQRVATLTASSCNAPAPVGTRVSACKNLPGYKSLVDLSSPPTFFLHEGPEHDWSAEESALWGMTPFSENMCPGQAQHQGSLFLLQALRKHPSRSRDKQNASIHVSAALLGVYGIGSAPCAHIDPAPYTERLDRLAETLGKANSTFRGGKPFVFLTATSTGEGMLFGHAGMNAALKLGNPIFLTNDANYLGQPQWREERWDDVRVARKQTRVLLPYLSDDHLAADSDGAATRMKDRKGVMFHGAMAKGDGLTRDVRVDMKRMLRKLNATSTPTDLRMEEVPETNVQIPWGGGGVPWEVSAAASAMQAARICIAPEGDTPMSRRLEDALAAGCVPVFYVAADEDTDGKLRELPLAHIIDWRSIVFFMKVSECPERDAAWLEGVHADVTRLQNMSTRGRNVFDKLLSYGRRTQDDANEAPLRLVSGLLKEVEIANGAAFRNVDVVKERVDPASSSTVSTRRCKRHEDTDFDRWFLAESPPRTATEKDCSNACSGEGSEHYTWCVGYQFIAFTPGAGSRRFSTTCKLFDDCTAENISRPFAAFGVAAADLQYGSLDYTSTEGASAK